MPWYSIIFHYTYTLYLINQSFLTFHIMGNALHYLGWIWHDSYVIIFCKHVRPSFLYILSILMTIQTFFYDSSHDYFTHHTLFLCFPHLIPLLTCGPFPWYRVKLWWQIIMNLRLMQIWRLFLSMKPPNTFFRNLDGSRSSRNLMGMMIRLHFSSLCVFHGGLAKVGELEFEVTEKFIYEAIQLPSTVKKWTKGQPVDKKICTQLLQPQYRKLQWSEGTSRSWLEPKWPQLLSIL